MKKRLWMLDRILFCVLLVGCLLTGCIADQGETGEEDGLSNVGETVENLFEESFGDETYEGEEDNDTQSGDSQSAGKIISSISIGIKTSLQNSQGAAYVVYEGGEMELVVNFTAEGTAANAVDLLLYVDGIPHAYRVKDLDESLLREKKTDGDEYRYIHTFKPVEGKQVVCTLCFTPLAGEEGESREVILESFTYGENVTSEKLSKRNMLGVVRPMVYQSTPPEKEPLVTTDNPILSSTVTEKEITTELKEEYEEYFYGDLLNRTSMDDWNRYPKARLWIDDTSMKKDQEYSVEGKNTILVCLDVLGPSLVRYQAVVYLDEEPVNIGEENFLEVNTQDGMIVTLEMELDVSALEEASSFYIILVPENYWEMRSLDVIPEAQISPVIRLTREEV